MTFLCVNFVWKLSVIQAQLSLENKDITDNASRPKKRRDCSRGCSCSQLGTLLHQGHATAQLKAIPLKTVFSGMQGEKEAKTNDFGKRKKNKTIPQTSINGFRRKEMGAALGRSLAEFPAHHVPDLATHRGALICEPLEGGDPGFPQLLPLPWLTAHTRC